MTESRGQRTDGGLEEQSCFVETQDWKQGHFQIVLCVSHTDGQHLSGDRSFVDA